MVQGEVYVENKIKALLQFHPRDVLIAETSWKLQDSEYQILHIP